MLEGYRVIEPEVRRVITDDLMNQLERLEPNSTRVGAFIGGKGVLDRIRDNDLRITEESIDSDKAKKVFAFVRQQMILARNLSPSAWVALYIERSNVIPSNATYDEIKRTIVFMDEMLTPETPQIAYERWLNTSQELFGLTPNESYVQFYDTMDDIIIQLFDTMVEKFKQTSLYVTFRDWAAQFFLTDRTSTLRTGKYNRGFLLTAPSNSGKSLWLRMVLMPFKSVDIMQTKYQSSEVYSKDVHLWKLNDFNSLERWFMVQLQNTIDGGDRWEIKHKQRSNENFSRPLIVLIAEDEPGECWKRFSASFGNKLSDLAQFKKRFQWVFAEGSQPVNSIDHNGLPNIVFSNDILRLFEMFPETFPHLREAACCSRGGLLSGPPHRPPPDL